jgi:hypothetical protein
MLEQASKNKKMILSTLWIVVMMNMIFADILGFMLPGALAEIMTGYGGSVKLTQAAMLIAALFLEIPIAMIFLSKVLKRKTNRLLNIIAASITILFVVGGGSLTLHYIFFAGVEVICMLAIIILSWKWKE